MERPDISIAAAMEAPGQAGIFELSKKLMAIRLRWLVVIICSYLLVFSGGESFPSSTAYAFMFLYVFSNIFLYLVNERLFESAYFYAPLVIFDTFCVTAALIVSRQVATDFYLAYFVIIILCAVLQDFLGSIVVATLSVLVYGYLLFNAGEIFDPGIYLRLPFLFIMALFYGYFAQVVRGEKVLRIQAQIRQIIAEQQADVERIKSEFLRNITHELRTPLTAIMGYGELLIDGDFGMLTVNQRKAAEGLMKSARGLFALIVEILDCSKLEKGKTGLVVKQQDLAPLLAQLRQELSDLEGKKSLKIKYDVGEDIPPIQTDWKKLKSILLSILKNAVKFTDRGEVRFSVLKGTNGEVSFVISDTGIGIAKEKIPLIFEKFRQLDGSQTRRYGGTGLGLAVSKNFADLIGGKIEVESEMGKGSTFTVTIPAVCN